MKLLKIFKAIMVVVFILRLYVYSIPLLKWSLREGGAIMASAILHIGDIFLAVLFLCYIIISLIINKRLNSKNILELLLFITFILFPYVLLVDFFTVTLLALLLLLMFYSFAKPNPQAGT